MTIRTLLLPLLLLIASGGDQARAGVTTFRFGDTLFLFGSDQRDEIFFTGYDATGAVLPKGWIAFMDNEGPSPGMPQVFSGINHVHIDLGAGQCQVSTNSTHIYASMFLRAGSEANFINLHRVHGDLDVRLGDGVSFLTASDVSGDVSIEVGLGGNGVGSNQLSVWGIDGDTEVIVEGYENTIYTRAVSGNLSLDLDGEENSTFVRGEGYLGDVFISASGTNTISVGSHTEPTSFVGDLTIRTFASQDDVTIKACSVLGSVDVQTGAGDDTVVLGTSNGNGQVAVSGETYINSGIHSDEVSLFSVSAAQVTIDTLSGSDSVEIDDCQFETLFARLRNGHDAISLHDSLVALWTFLDGGNHTDDVEVTDSDLGSVTHQNFENSNLP